MNRSKKGLLIGVAVSIMLMTMLYPAPQLEEVPLYHIRVKVTSLSNTTKSDDIRVNTRVPRPAGMLLAWESESIYGGINETINGTMTFRFRMSALVQFILRNRSHITSWFIIDSVSDRVSVLSLSSTSGDYLCEGWVEIHHWGSDLVYYPVIPMMIDSGGKIEK